MSTLNVWVNGAWTLVDLKGPPGDQGPTGPAGTNTLTTTGVTFKSTQTNVPDNTNLQPTGLTVVKAGASPCFTVSGTNSDQLKAAKAGMYAVSMSVLLGVVTPADAWNFIFMSRTVADAAGNKLFGNGDLANGANLSSCSGLVWLAQDEIIYFVLGKQVGANADVTFDIRTVMIS